MKTSHEGIQTLKYLEGCKLTSYLCPAGVWTRGYGHTKKAKPGQTITQEQAVTDLFEDILPIERALTDIFGDELHQHEFDAVVLFVFNIGLRKFRESTMFKLLLDGKNARAADEFPRWINAGGKPLKGLVIRRDIERRMFEEGKYDYPVRRA